MHNLLGEYRNPQRKSIISGPPIHNVSTVTCDININVKSVNAWLVTAGAVTDTATVLILTAGRMEGGDKK